MSMSAPCCGKKSELSYIFVIGATLFDCRRVQWQQIAPEAKYVIYDCLVQNMRKVEKPKFRFYSIAIN